MFPLYAILDTALAARYGYAPPDLARRFFDGGARLLQVRAKDAASGQFLEWADEICASARACGALVIVNDRADIALMSGAAGVHVGQDDMPPDAVRRIASRPMQIGLSTHTSAQIGAASREPIDYLAIGPVFATGTKDTGYPAVGLGMVAEAAGNAARLPVVAIGGITLDTAPRVLEAGAAGVAVISDLLLGPPEARVRAYVRALS